MKPYGVVKSQGIYRGKILDVRKDTVFLPNGKNPDREVIEHNGGAAVVAVDSGGNILMVKQHRHAAGDFVLEIPAGKLEKGEDPLECAKRELAEETGFLAKKISFMFKAYPTVGYSTEILYFYLATGLIKGQISPDEDEFLEVLSLGPGEVLDMISKGEIIDMKTISGILFYKEFLACKI